MYNDRINGHAHYTPITIHIVMVKSCFIPEFHRQTTFIHIAYISQTYPMISPALMVAVKSFFSSSCYPSNPSFAHAHHIPRKYLSPEKGKDGLYTGILTLGFHDFGVWWSGWRVLDGFRVLEFRASGFRGLSKKNTCPKQGFKNVKGHALIGAWANTGLAAKSH